MKQPYQVNSQKFRKIEESMDIDSLPTSRKEAIELGVSHYVTGNLCNYGHTAIRNTKTTKCLQCHREYEAKRRRKASESSKDYWAKVLYYSRKAHAKKEGLKFEIEVGDLLPIPDVCPVLGIPIYRNEEKHGPNSPSVDKLIPSKGYVKGNVRVISWRANSIKSDATIDEVEAVLKYMKEYDNAG